MNYDRFIGVANSRAGWPPGMKTDGRVSANRIPS